MSHIIKKTILLTAGLMMAALPVLADEGSDRSTMGSAIQGGKDQCLLAAAGSCDRVGTFQGMITKVQGEINKGNAVYTNEELKVLHERLDRLIQQRDEAYSPG